MSIRTLQLPKTQLSAEWREALRFGAVVALVHRAFLTIWLAASGLLATQIRGANVADYHMSVDLPAFKSTLGELLFGVWRRFDGVHYLDLACNGYLVERPQISAFGLLTPGLIRVVDWVLPGPMELAAILIETLAFLAAAALLYRICERIYSDAQLARWSVIVLALHPLSHYLAAPMSDALYLTFSLACVYALLRDRWAIAGLAGFFATLARHQGVVLVVPAAIIVLQHILRQKTVTVREALAWSPALALPPLSYLVFVLFRASLNLPPIEDVLLSYYDIAFVDPLTGLALNLRLFITHTAASFRNMNVITLVLALGLLAFSIVSSRHRHWPLIGYTASLLLLFVSKISSYSDGQMFTNSIARYSLALFPLIIVLADWLKGRRKWLRLGVIGLMLTGLLMFSAVYAFGYGPH